MSKCNIFTALFNLRKIKLYNSPSSGARRTQNYISVYLQLQLIIIFIMEYSSDCLFFFQGAVTKNSEQGYSD